MNKKEQKKLDKCIMKLIEVLMEEYRGMVVVEEAEKCLIDLNEKNKYKSYRVDCSLKNFNYRQHKQERANYDCYKLIKSNAELLMKWKRHFHGIELYRHDIKRAYVEIYLASAKTLAFTQENARFLSNEYRRGLNNNIKGLTELLDELMNEIEYLKEED